ncbi:MAG: DUF1028 domain-containing protein, partial [SAR202 cluster bacterium]|nr:DUF1028 domain-containing protein [SAR202 cluster bacterium]
GVATYSLGVGGYCPIVREGVAAVSSQAFANPWLGKTAMRLLESSDSPETVLEKLQADDPHFEFRQVGIVAHSGRAACHTGANTRAKRGHVLGDGYVAMGNVLGNDAVVREMAAAFESSEGRELEERLLKALEAGRAAGGQGHLNERSAALIVSPLDGSDMGVDLRVDVHQSAVEEIRRVWSEYRPYREYYNLRANQPHLTPPQEQWARQNKGR